MNILSRMLAQRRDPPLTSAQSKQLDKLLRRTDDRPNEADVVEVVDAMETADDRLNLADEATAYANWLLDVLCRLASAAERSTSADELAAVMADFAGTTGLISKLDDAVSDLRKVIDRVNQLTANAFALAEISNVNIRGKTVYLSTSIAAGIAVTPDASDDVKQAQRRKACAVFKTLGYADLVSESIHAQRLSSWVKEHERSQDVVVSGDNIVEQFDLPDRIKKLLNVTQRTDVRVRKGK